MEVVMTIAGSDSGGGAGIQADLKTFQELGVFGTSVITALTAQNTLGVSGIFPASPEFVRQQLETVLEDLPVRAVKTGMLFSAEIIRAVANVLQAQSIQLVVDPVMIAKGGASLLQEDAVKALKDDLLPLAAVITPNLPEAEVLSGMRIQTAEHIEEAARRILSLGTACLVMKGGHWSDSHIAADRVYFADGRSFMMQSRRIQTRHTHGTGCTFSAALTACLGQGIDTKKSIITAKKYVQLAIEHSLELGHGHGPTNHFAYRRYHGESEVTVIEA
ncbi:bifunctional hydroxymethylpyrimidine kinase/phosphomethylpyrimidine kinase [Marinicrinis lubricantis]|uniref:Hydroxymethylpyrimidine/phosphomethylpyrimidine kinase n=1 Tax=Marinicrinis lubricantis TaxID=2086470 RepID=A0ABW1IPP5_9BACL